MNTNQKANLVKKEFDEKLDRLSFTAYGNIVPPYHFIISNSSTEMLTKVKISDLEEAKEIVTILLGDKYLDSISDNSEPNGNQKYLHIQLKPNK